MGLNHVVPEVGEFFLSMAHLETSGLTIAGGLWLRTFLMRNSPWFIPLIVLPFGLSPLITIISHLVYPNSWLVYHGKSHLEIRMISRG